MHCNPLQGNYRVELLHREIPVVITGNGFAVCLKNNSLSMILKALVGPQIRSMYSLTVHICLYVYCSAPILNERATYPIA